MDNLEQNPPRQYLTQALKLVYRNPRKKSISKSRILKKLIKNQERQASIETCRFVGAGNQNRTDDLVITNEVKNLVFSRVFKPFVTNLYQTATYFS